MALRGLRGKKDITQAELDARLGISQKMMPDMESGKRDISVKMVKRIIIPSLYLCCLRNLRLLALGYPLSAYVFDPDEISLVLPNPRLSSLSLLSRWLTGM